MIRLPGFGKKEKPPNANVFGNKGWLFYSGGFNPVHIEILSIRPMTNS